MIHNGNIWKTDNFEKDTCETWQFWKEKFWKWQVLKDKTVNSEKESSEKGKYKKKKVWKKDKPEKQTSGQLWAWEATILKKDISKQENRIMAILNRNSLKQGNSEKGKSET